MQLTRVIVAASVLVAVIVIATAELNLTLAPTAPAPVPSSPPSILSVWEDVSFQGSFAGGMAHPSVIGVSKLPNQTDTVYVDGSFGSVSYTVYTDGLFNRSGTCGEPFAEAGACSLYVGIWTPEAWATYAAGGPMDPLWCYPGTGTACENVSAAEFGTPNLSAHDGASWEIVVWNLASVGVSGSYQFTVYSSTPPA